MEDREDGFIDMSREFTCYLCNGYTTVIGSISINVAGIRLTNAAGMDLEIDSFESLVSVNEMEPPNNHTLILVFPIRYVMISHLLRKEKLVDVFKDVGLYRSDPTLPPEAVGFVDPKILNERLLGTSRHTSTDDFHETDPSPPNRREMVQSEERRDPWDNKNEQDRYIQREIRQQSVLNPVQLISSIQQGRVREGFVNNAQSDYKQLDRYPSSVTRNTDKPSTEKVTKTTSSQKQQKILSSSVANLKLLFPNHDIEELESTLKECDYSFDSAITVLLGEDDLANAH